MHPLIAHQALPDVERLTGSTFIIDVADTTATASLHRINRFACAYGIPWLPIRIADDTVRFGPTVLPGGSACLLCAELRAAAQPRPPAPSPLQWRGAGGEVPSLVALEVLQTLLGGPSRARGHLGLLDREHGLWTWHPVLRHPRCPVCGALPWQQYASPSRIGRPGALWAGGGMGSLVDEETGIVRAVAPVPCPPDEPEPPYVALAFLTNTQFRDDWDALPPGEQTTTGKGWTAEAARNAALGEALERYCAMLPPAPETFRVASLTALDEPAIGPAAFGLYHPVQYADGSVPYPPVTDDTVLHWIEGRSLTDDRPVLVPASLVYLLPLDRFSQQTSNGLAAGRTYAAAALRALCEVIERDAFIFTWLTSRPVPLLDLTRAGDAVARIARHYAARGIALTAHDLTTTTGVPVILARAHDEHGRPPIDLIGLGCDPDPRRGIERAVLEAVQGRRARWDELADAGTPETIRTHSDHARWYALTDRSAAFAFLGARPGALPAPVATEGDDAAALLSAIVATLARVGRETVIVDITTPDVRAVGMTVVRALVTGLLPVHFGIGQERLGSARLADAAITRLNRAPHPLA
jgi:ribosomal protein S12 methylthiotransferase accessory factor